jgi:hypothetical protein
MTCVAAGSIDDVSAEATSTCGATATHRAVPPVALADLFADRSAATWRAEHSGAFEWGDEIGRDVVEE